MKHLRRALLALLLAAPALPQEGDRERAQALLAEGVRHFAQREWAAALEQFEAAYRAFPSPKLLVNIGAACRELDRPVEALAAYERFLREAGPDVPPDAVEEARSGVAAMAARVGEIALDARPGTELALDGKLHGRAPLARFRVAAGPHRATLILPGGATQELLVEVRGAEVTVVRPALDAPAAARGAAPPRSLYRRWPFWAAVGLALAGAAVGGVLLASGGAGAEPIPDGDVVVDLRAR